MRMPELNNILTRLLSHIFSQNPEVQEIAWKNGSNNQDPPTGLEFRTNSLFKNEPYSNGDGNELDNNIYKGTNESLKNFTMFVGYVGDGKVKVYKRGDYE